MGWRNVVVATAAVWLVACTKPAVTHCSDVDCPQSEVCDLRGGCAFPEQISSCQGQQTGAQCSYTDATKTLVQGLCTDFGECYPVRCGDAIVEPGEVCDFGAEMNVTCTGCSPDCLSDETCGNNYVDVCKGEQCDLGGANSNAPDAACRVDCTYRRCGDGIVDVQHGEQCDNGAANADVANTCRTNCTLPRCGDGIVDTGEVCDDGNNISGDGCSADCKSNETCGNDYVDFIKGEQCDLGTANSNAPNAACRTNCQLPKCGDDIVDNLLGEQCDLGTMNSNAPNAMCRTNCSLQRCGDDIVDPMFGEQCDLGIMNSNAPNQACRSNCLPRRCGDGIVDNTFGEQCDTSGFDSPTCVGGTCKTSACGDGYTNIAAGEQCDTGSTADSTTCVGTTCKTSFCGDNHVNTVAGEQCDTGAGNPDSTTCVGRTCKTSSCGDGYTNTVAGEQCDTGTGNPDSATCVGATCKTSICGDSHVNTAAGEQCDTGPGTPDTTTCVGKTCKTSRCGDGYTNTVAGEQCDSSGFDSPTCIGATCKTSSCGDGYVNFAAGEQCDTGTGNPNTALCVGATCKTSYCGDGVTNTAAGEQCDTSGVTTATCVGSTCKTSRCGDGFTNTLAGEQCDPGGQDTATCVASTCKTSSCGDGYTNLAAGEQCDTSGVDTAACVGSTCKFSYCGDGHTDVAAGEQCDSSGVDTATCIGKTCKLSVCGDGYVNVAAGEQCDDGNTRPKDGCSACKSEDAIVVQPGITPPMRRDAGIAYDAGRQRVVMFGGFNGSYLGDTWEWDGVSWTQILAKTAPTARTQHAMAYDATRHRVVLFGGLGASGNLSDTWEWDGTSWKQAAPALPPSARFYAAMSYDAHLKHCILYGGNTGTTAAPVANAETWEWDGTAWTKLTTATSPGGRYGGSAAYDSKNNYVVMYGGQLDNHVFTFDGTNWTDRGAQAVDLALHMALAYDPTRSAIVLWHLAGTTWEWNGTSFAAVAAATPTARDGTTMTYDAIRKQLVLFGGYTVSGTTTTYDADTWLRTGASSTAWATAAAWVEPSARQRGASGYDPLRGVSVVYGGQTTTYADSASERPGDTWEFDGRGWTQKSPTVDATLAANPRAGGTLEYDTSTKNIIMFGGDDVTSYNCCTPAAPCTCYQRNFHDDVFTYNGSAWTQAAASTTRTDKTQQSSVAYDGGHNKLITFGGTIPYTDQTKTWLWDPTAGWTNPTPATSPSARHDNASAYDEVRGATFMFGGINASNVNVADLWQWDGTTWSQITGVFGPEARRCHTMYFNGDGGFVSVYGHSGNGSEDLYEWNGTAWVNRVIANAPAERVWASYAYDRARRDLVIFGGRTTGFAMLAQTIVLRYRANTTPEACTSSTIDYDGDGLAGCADDECWGVCDPLHPPGTTRPAGAPYCGDAACNGIEDCRICPGDCGACSGLCGDFHCDSGETSTTCPNDC